MIWVNYENGSIIKYDNITHLQSEGVRMQGVDNIECVGMDMSVYFDNIPHAPGQSRNRYYGDMAKFVLFGLFLTRYKDGLPCR